MEKLLGFRNMQKKLEKHICYQETPQLNKSLVTFVVYEKCAGHNEVEKNLNRHYNSHAPVFSFHSAYR